jgi:ribonuclease HI
MYIQIYTDGACSKNPGLGGWAAIVITKDQIIRLYGHEGNTTNNRMELTAPLKALQFVQKAPFIKKVKRIDIYSDSAYVVNAINMKWVKKWYLKDWTSKAGTKIKNVDLWSQLHNIMQEIQCNINFIKVKGHSGNLLNEEVDKLAKQMVFNQYNNSNEYILEPQIDTQI